MIDARIFSTFAEVDIAVERTRKCFQNLECSKLSCKMAYILFAFRELLNNAVEHGNLQDSQKRITYRITCNGREVQLDVWDEGSGFELSNERTGDSAKSILEMSSLGLFIIRKLDFTLFGVNGHITATLNLD